MRILLLSSVVIGCASTPSYPSDPPLAAYPSPQGPRPRGMRNCPSALAGATTRVTETEDGVDLQITATDPGVQQQIVELAMVHEHLGPPSRSGAHTGLHEGPGDIGYCPVIHVGTTVTSRRRSDGVVIHVHALASDAVPQIQRAIAERVALLATRTR